MLEHSHRDSFRQGGGGKILVCYHKRDKLFKNEVLVPIHCGRALACEASKDGKMSEEDYQWMLDNMIGDDTGDNISKLNRDVNEMSAIYWAWKNYDKLGNPDYIGLCHYRRFFDFSDILKIHSLKLLNLLGLNNKSLNKIFSKYETVFREGTRVFKLPHSFDGYQEIVNLSETYHPILYKQYQKFQKERIYYFNNMFIMKKEDFFEYCEEVFPLMFDFLAKSQEEVSATYLNWVKENWTEKTYLKLKRETDSNNNIYPRITGYMMEYISSFYFSHLNEKYKENALGCPVINPQNRFKFLSQKLFSIRNSSDKIHKKIYILGFKLEFKRK